MLFGMLTLAFVSTLPSRVQRIFYSGYYDVVLGWIIGFGVALATAGVFWGVLGG